MMRDGLREVIREMAEDSVWGWLPADKPRLYVDRIQTVCLDKLGYVPGVAYIQSIISGVRCDLAGEIKIGRLKRESEFLSGMYFDVVDLTSS